MNFLLHGAGWLEGGLAFNYKKLMTDCVQLGMLQRLYQGHDLIENGQTLDAIREVGPGEYYLECIHDQANFDTVFYRSKIADPNSFEQWSAEGGLDHAQRANVSWKKRLKEHSERPLDPAKDKELIAFVSKKKSTMEETWS